MSAYHDHIAQHVPAGHLTRQTETKRDRHTKTDRQIDIDRHTDTNRQIQTDS